MKKIFRLIFKIICLPYYIPWAIFHLRKLSQEQKRREIEYQRILDLPENKAKLKRL